MTKKLSHIEESILTWKIVVLFFIIFVSEFLPIDIYIPILALIGAVVLLFVWSNFKSGFTKIIKPLLGILIIGLIGMHGHQSHHILRDIFYAFFPLSLLIIGYWIAIDKRMWPRILKIIVFFGVIFSIIHLSQFIFQPELFLENVDDLRHQTAIYGGRIVTLSLVLGLLQYRIGLYNLFPKIVPRKVGLFLLLMSLLFSFSRVDILIGFILTITIIGFVQKINFRSILNIALLIGGIFIVLLTIPSFEVGTFGFKIENIIQEISIRDYPNAFNALQHWRGFESFVALASFESGSTFQKIFGQGFGALVNLPFTVNLGGEYYNAIPILHNGYVYIIFKTGLLGILCYIFFYFSLLKISLKINNSLNQNQILFSRFLLGLTLALMISMFVVGGMAEVHDSVYILLVGFILRRIE
jgi:hypothetical protein